jgi:hypothetical protein
MLVLPLTNYAHGFAIRLIQYKSAVYFLFIKKSPKVSEVCIIPKLETFLHGGAYPPPVMPLVGQQLVFLVFFLSVTFITNPAPHENHVYF